MFGFLWALFVGGAAIKDSIDNESYKRESKVNALQNHKDIYFDKNGNEYYNGVLVHRDINHIMSDGTKHNVILNPKTSIIIKDYTQEIINDFFVNRKEIIKRAVENNDLFYIIQCPLELYSYKEVYEKVIKGYCGSFETKTGKRYNLEVIRNKSTNYKSVFKKYSYEIYKYGRNLFDYYYHQCNPVIITEEEYIMWGGADACNDKLVFIPKNGVI